MEELFKELCHSSESKDSINAVCVAIKAISDKLDWYKSSANWKFYLFRATGVAAILSSVLVTYLSANIDNQKVPLLGLKKKNLVSVLAALTAVSISLAGFFGWRSSWESHRLAQLQLEALVTNTKIEMFRLKANDDDKALFNLAHSADKALNEIVFKETQGFFSGVKDANNGAI